VPLVVLLHGVGEAGDPRAGASAWTERYGSTEVMTTIRPIRTADDHKEALAEIERLLETG
jgi:hypothetical protein